ncbi:7-carboxy-7-deazaguanine synthase QueE [Domibacillus iocasae]|uniref:7-carboxy-7-deazaguanine synthase n=1 Tax=Domibacillus iocasae TaxID=1714016 RepID=A0A1E7DTT5_9BACI|nr:7-carboxy-7-deazaguanine synthase QueE [Domibacillus iocasae]OES46493.1 7-cyano-7-deazaguanosine (preQ0) biosynthesis protein QueE [Domibacillus iocasae]
MIPVLEIFGPTVQGEGAVIGRKTMFVRTAGCDYRCSWCDSAFTWDGSAKEDIRKMTPEEIYKELKEIGGDTFDHVTISGGNPALLPHIDGLLQLFKEKGITSALETQGSKYQPWFHDIDELTISPKPPSSGMDSDFDKLAHILNEVKGQFVSLKVVVFNEEDLAYAKNVHQRFPEVPFYLQVGNDQLNETDDGKLLVHLASRYEWLINLVMPDPEFKRVRVLPQLHTFVWGNKKGV